MYLPTSNSLLYPKISEDVPNNSEVLKRMIMLNTDLHNVIYSGFAWTFESHISLQVYKLLESASVKAVIAHIFQPGVRNWSVSVILLATLCCEGKELALVKLGV